MTTVREELTRNYGASETSSEADDGAPSLTDAERRALAAHDRATAVHEDYKLSRQIPDARMAQLKQKDRELELAMSRAHATRNFTEYHHLAILYRHNHAELMGHLHVNARAQDRVAAANAEAERALEHVRRAA